MPWVLRHAHSPCEYEVVRVNGQTLTVDQTMACLDFLWNEGRINDDLLRQIERDLDLQAVCLR